MNKLFSPWCVPHVAVGILVCAIFVAPASVQAATLSFSGGSGVVGKTVSVSVLVTAEAGESLNGISSEVSYPTDKLSLLSISKAGSIITFWAEEPSFSNSAGSASIEGIVPNPGYSGQNGRVVTFVFQVRAPGTATLSFQNPSILANDGRGTDILSQAFSRTITLTAPTVEETPVVVPTVPVKPTKPTPPATPATATSTATSTHKADVPATVTNEQPTNALVIPIPQEKTLLRTVLYVLAIIGLAGLVVAGYLSLMRLIAAERRRRQTQADIIDRSFALLKKDLHAHMAKLRDTDEGKALTKKEIAFLASFEEDLTAVETIVHKKIKDQRISE